MKRSEINKIIKNGIKFFKEMNFLLPHYAYFSKEDWEKATNCQEIFDLQLGWDVTAFGCGDFERMGLLLFTLRNGKLNHPEYPKPYAEKIMMVLEGQVTPRHFHWKKREDIINRGGGNLVVELFHANPMSNSLTGKNFDITIDGFKRHMKSGEKLILHPGESVCIEPIHCHTFYGETGAGPVLVGEVSMANDDANDNCFVDGMPRFDHVEEDDAIETYLSADYFALNVKRPEAGR
ncbi:MAG: D-lyxose/D-mannose family sugar isomerase [Victivallaceae bacterium]